MNETCSSGESISGPDCCCVLGQEYTYEFSLDGYDLHDDARCEYLWERLAQRRCVPGETVRKPLELDHNVRQTPAECCFQP